MAAGKGTTKAQREQGNGSEKMEQKLEQAVAKAVEEQREPMNDVLEAVQQLAKDVHTMSERMDELEEKPVRVQSSSVKKPMREVIEEDHEEHSILKTIGHGAWVGFDAIRPKVPTRNDLRVGLKSSAYSTLGIGLLGRYFDPAGDLIVRAIGRTV